MCLHPPPAAREGEPASMQSARTLGLPLPMSRTRRARRKKGT